MTQPKISVQLGNGFLWTLAMLLVTAPSACRKENASREEGDRAETTMAKSEPSPSHSAPQRPKTIDQVLFRQEPIVVDRLEARNVSLKDTRFEEALAQGLKMMTTDSEGQPVLGGLRDDPTRYQLDGEVAGTVLRTDTKEVLATYKFRVTKIVAGKTERLADAYLICQGTYWLPVPIPKPDLPWASIPPTYVVYEVPKSGFGVLIRAEAPVARSDLEVDRLDSDKDLESRFVLTGDFKPAIFGNKSIHLPLEPIPKP